MKKITYIYRTALVMGAALLAGCNFLSEQSQEEVIPKTAKDLGEVLMGSGYPLPTQDCLSFLYLLDDDTQSNHAGVPSIAGYQSYQDAFAAHTWQPDMADRLHTAPSLANGSAYSQLYTLINACNAILDLVDGSIGSPEERAIVKAEALALRAFHYLYLVNIYAAPYNTGKDSPGVVLKVVAGVDAEPMRRSTVAEVYAHIVADLRESIELFSQCPPSRGNYRINLSAAYILLSRTYLYMEEWDNCIEAATHAIALGNGLSDIRGNESWAPVAVYQFGETEWVYGYTKSDSGPTTDNIEFVPSTALVSLYDMDNDKRYKTFFRSAGRPAGTGYYSAMVVNKNDYAMVTRTMLGNSVRIAEAFMNRAEAYVRKNDPKAADDINAIRSNRIMGYTPVASVTLDDVLTERRKEFCFEIPRWFDLRRNGMPGIVHTWRSGENEPELTYTLKANDPMYTLPIPSGAFGQNGALTQNDSRDSGERQGTM